MHDPPKVTKGRGAVSNLDGRFESYAHHDIDDGWYRDEASALRTSVSVDATRSIIAKNQSPDVPFEQSINPYRGCEHGCIYCFARPTHAFLGLSPGLDFETRLFYKPDAANLFRRAIAKPGYRCQVIALGTNTDPYQPIENKYRVMRQILEVCLETRHPVCVTTKSDRILRDVDLLGELAAHSLVSVAVSVTTLRTELTRTMEPRAPSPAKRLRAIHRLARAGVPVSVSVAPVIPTLTDTEMERIMKTAADHGAWSASYILLRLPLEVKDLFKEWLSEHHQGRAEHVMSLIRQSRRGRENDPEFETRRRGTGVFADMIEQRFRQAIRKYNLKRELPDLNTASFRKPAGGTQLDLGLD